MRAFMFKHFGASLVLTVSLTASGPALSQSARPEADTSQRADEHFRRGKEFVRAGNTRGAYEEYRQAWSLKQTFDTAANLGNIELTLGMPRDAAEHLAFSLRTYAVTGTTKEQIDRTRDVFAQARARVMAVSIKTNVDGAEVLLDGRPIGRSPMVDEVYVDPGAHEIEARLSMFAPAKAVLRGEKGSSASVTLVIEAAPVHSEGPTTALIIAGSAVGAVAIGTGIAMLAIASNKANSAGEVLAGMRQAGVACTTPPQPGQCADVLARQQDHDTFQNIGVPLLITGSTVAVATLLYGLWPRSKAMLSAVYVIPAIGPNASGVRMGGAF